MSQLLTSHENAQLKALGTVIGSTCKHSEKGCVTLSIDSLLRTHFGVDPEVKGHCLLYIRIVSNQWQVSQDLVLSLYNIPKSVPVPFEELISALKPILQSGKFFTQK